MKTKTTNQNRAEQIEKAAPDMYEAINAVLNSPSHENEMCPAFKLLRAARDKADGKNQEVE